MRSKTRINRKGGSRAKRISVGLEPDLYDLVVGSWRRLKARNAVPHDATFSDFMRYILIDRILYSENERKLERMYMSEELFRLIIDAIPLSKWHLLYGNIMDIVYEYLVFYGAHPENDVLKFLFDYLLQNTGDLHRAKITMDHTQPGSNPVVTVMLTHHFGLKWSRVIAPAYAKLLRRLEYKVTNPVFSYEHIGEKKWNITFSLLRSQHHQADSSSSLNLKLLNQQVLDFDNAEKGDEYRLPRPSKIDPFMLLRGTGRVETGRNNRKISFFISSELENAITKLKADNQDFTDFIVEILTEYFLFRKFARASCRVYVIDTILRMFLTAERKKRFEQLGDLKVAYTKFIEEHVQSLFFRQEEEYNGATWREKLAPRSLFEFIFNRLLRRLGHIKEFEFRPLATPNLYLLGFTHDYSAEWSHVILEAYKQLITNLGLEIAYSDAGGRAPSSTGNFTAVLHVSILD